jgi:LAO/AO transport system kinase
LDESCRTRDIRALARLLTFIQRGERVNGSVPPAGSATLIGVTGAPGVGKSSLIGKLGRYLTERGHRVAVVAVDPTSPITGGALLGDRLRMMSGTPSESFFIRSFSSGKAQGGLAPHCREAVQAMGAFGFDFVLIETVGAGQGDVAIRELTDEILLVLMPGSGDSVQFSKSGIMEIVSGFVLNKCDLQGADVTEAHLRSAIGYDRPIWCVSTVRDEGLERVTDWADALRTENR